MQNENEEQKFCKKLVWREDNKPILVLYGLIVRESESHIEFKTAHKTYYLSKNFLIKIEDTNRVFRSADLELTSDEKAILEAKPSEVQE